MLHLTRSTAAAALAIGLAVPASAAAGTPRQDLRNADQRTPALEPSTRYQDLRNPDRRAPVAGGGQVVTVPETRIVEVPASGFDWGDAGIGAAGGLAVVAIAAGGTMLLAQRRRAPRMPVAH